MCVREGVSVVKRGESIIPQPNRWERVKIDNGSTQRVLLSAPWDAIKHPLESKKEGKVSPLSDITMSSALGSQEESSAPERNIPHGRKIFNGQLAPPLPLPPKGTE